MHRVTITILLFFSFHLLYAQDSKPDTIHISYKSLIPKYYQKDKKLNSFHLKPILSTYADSEKQFKKSQKLKITSYIFSFSGAFLLGYELGSAIRGDELNKAILGSGIGMVAITVAFEILSINRKKLAVELYNNEVTKKNQQLKLQKF